MVNGGVVGGILFFPFEEFGENVADVVCFFFSEGGGGGEVDAAW